MGLVGDRCAHRRVKLDVRLHDRCRASRARITAGRTTRTGQCVEQPGEPAGSTFKDKVQIPSYPVQELAGVDLRVSRPAGSSGSAVAALGPAGVGRLLSRHRLRDRAVQLAAVHGEHARSDAHGAICTASTRSSGCARKASRTTIRADGAGARLRAPSHQARIRPAQVRTAPRLADRRPDRDGNDTWTSSAPLVFPNTHVTSGSGRHDFGWRVPIDDTHTMQFMLRAFQPGNGVERSAASRRSVLRDAGARRSRATSSRSTRSTAKTSWPGRRRARSWTAPSERLGDSDRGIIAYRQLLARAARSRRSGSGADQRLPRSGREREDRAAGPVGPRPRLGLSTRTATTCAVRSRRPTGCPNRSPRKSKTSTSRRRSRTGHLVGAS